MSVLVCPVPARHQVLGVVLFGALPCLVVAGRSPDCRRRPDTAYRLHLFCHIPVCYYRRGLKSFALLAQEEESLLVAVSWSPARQSLAAALTCPGVLGPATRGVPCFALCQRKKEVADPSPVIVSELRTRAVWLLLGEPLPGCRTTDCRRDDALLKYCRLPSCWAVGRLIYSFT